MQSFGDRLYERINAQRNLLFIQGELSQLTYQAYTQYVQWINESSFTHIDVTFPIGLNPDKTSINSTNSYEKEELTSRYEYLGHTQLPINGIYQLVTIIEALLTDILRTILIEFPGKISNKRKIDADVLLNANTLDEARLIIVNIILNEFNYKSPKDFAEEFEKLTTIKLLEKPVYHRYIELKATRDIYIHNSGIANTIYVSKADTLARVNAGIMLPVTIQYFLESYESCLQLTEVLESSLDSIWPSADFRESKIKNASTIHEQQENAIEQAIEKNEGTTGAKDITKPKPRKRRTSKKQA